MKKLNRSSALWMTGLLSILMLFASGTCLAEDGDGEDEGHKFDSRQRLERTVLLQDRQALADAREALERAQAALERAIAAGAPQETIDRLEAEVERRELAIENGHRDIRRVRQLIAGLSDEQVFAFNRALNNVVQNGLVDDLDAQTLQRALGADLDRRQINAVTKALEQEARFLQQAERFRELAESTGEERFLKEAERAEGKAEREREKFLARVQREPAVINTDDAHGEKRLALRAQALSVGKDEAQRHARKLAKGHARKLAKAVVDEELRSQQRHGTGSPAPQKVKKLAKDVKQNPGLALGHKRK
jgi:hypothetical protein